MTRRALLRALAMLAGVVLAPPIAVEPIGTPFPATPIAVSAAIPGAVPVSMLVRNDGDEADRLLSGTSSVAERVETHRTRLVDGQREMMALPDGVVIPPHATIILEPGADHLMLIGLREGLVQGTTFPLTLHFAGAGDVAAQARVRRKVDAAGVAPILPATVGELTIALVSAPPAPKDPQPASPVGKVSPRSATITLAAFRPEAIETPGPGWVPESQR